MARTKPSPLSVIRKKVAREHKLKATALSGSGYHNLQIRNAKRDGTLPPPTNEGVEATFGAAAKKHASKVVKNHKPAPLSFRSRPKLSPPPEVEWWSPAGGDSYSFLVSNPDQPASKVLGVARIASWRTAAFIVSLKQFLKDSATMEDVRIMTRDLDYGGEPQTDVHIAFRSELVAEAAKEKINAVLLEGRKLQVRFA